jgi:hypothetical protein
MQNFMRSSQGDRFISTRASGEDAATLFGTKVELFSADKNDQESEDRRNSTQVNQSQVKDSSLIEEENKKLYTALLQNQVLGIDNPFLLHEMHNSDENHLKTNLYSQLQRQNQIDDTREPGADARKSALLSGCGLSSDSSPFNSKFTVLKFNNPTPYNGKFGFGKHLSEPGTTKGIFSNATNTSFSQY